MSPTWRKLSRDAHDPDSANWKNKNTGSSTSSLTPVSSTALGVDTKPPKCRSKSGGYFKTQKTHYPRTSFLSFWRKLAKWPHSLKFLATFLVFLLKNSSKSALGRGGGAGGLWRTATNLATLKQEKTLPHQAAFLFFWRKIDTASKKFWRKFAFFSDRIHQSSPFVAGAGSCRHKSVYWATVLMVVYKSVAS